MTQPPPQSVHARVGTVLREKWVLGEVIGGGGTAVVYEGTHRTNGRRVAVKVMHAHLAEAPEVVTRFMREGYIANKVGHPGAVTILDDDTTEDGSPFLVMDRLDGAPLTRLLERAKDGLEIGPSLRIAHEVLDVLAAAHAQGITHRDIKPDNVFLTASGKVMLLDFGIARIHEHIRTAARSDMDKTVRMQQTQEGLALGTPLYMPPEQARGRWAEVDGRSDLFALGAILFRMLTGRPVRMAETPADMLLQAMSEQPRPVGEIAPQLPADVQTIVDRALQFKKEDRWADAREMQAAVRDAAARIAAAKGSGARPLAVGSAKPTLPSAPDPVVAPAAAARPVMVSVLPPPADAPSKSSAPRGALSSGKGKIALAVVALLVVFAITLTFAPSATHGPAAKPGPQPQETAAPAPAAAPAPTTAPAESVAAAPPAPPASTPAANVDDLPSATVSIEPTSPSKPARPRRRATPAPAPTDPPPPATAAVAPDPAPSATGSVLDRRH